MSVILLDVEATALTVPNAAELDQQPHIMEIAALKISDRPEVADSWFTTLLKPPLMSEEATEITGITAEMVEDAPSFLEVTMDLARFFCGARRLVAHNLEYDLSCLRYELERLNLVTSFPWPYEQWCTWRTMEEIPERLRPQSNKLGVIYEHITGNKLEDAHRARNDVEALRVIYEWQLEKLNG